MRPVMPVLVLFLLFAVASCQLERAVLGSHGGQNHPGGIDPASLLLWRNAQVHDIERAPVLDAEAVYTLSLTHQVSALNKADGTLRWQISLPVSTPGRSGFGLALAGGTLVVGDIDLFGLDPATGQVRWTYHPSVGAWPGFGTLTTDGTTIYTGSATGHVFAVDGASGAERWTAHLVADTNTNVFTPAVAQGVVYAAYTDFFLDDPPVTRGLRGGAAALDAATGRVLWSVYLPKREVQDFTDVYNLALTADRVVLAPGNGRLYGLDRATGEVRDTVPAATFLQVGTIAPPGVYASFPRALAAAEDLVLVGEDFVPPNGPNVTALSASALNRRIWHTLTIGSAISVALDSSFVYVGHGAGQFLVLRRADGSEVWRINRYDLRPHDGNEGLSSAPAIEGDRLYLGGYAEVYAFKKQ